MAFLDGRTELHIAPGFQPVFRELGIDGDLVFTDPRVVCWRQLPDRENCTLDATLADGRTIRWHIKRYAPSKKGSAAAREIAGIDLLRGAQIPTATVVGWGERTDGRSVVILEDLTDFRPADKLVAGGMPFQLISTATADLAARMHARGVHHRDLYLCHFLAPVNHGGSVLQADDLRLIDAARVRKLPRFFARGRWIVKDVAQFWFSTLKLPITDDQRTDWVTRYSQQRAHPGSALLTDAVLRKVKQIARHDARLHLHRPERDVSIAT